MFDVASLDGALRIGVYIAAGAVVWLLIDKTFRKIISNQHKAQHAIDQALFYLDALAGDVKRIEKSVEQTATAQVPPAVKGTTARGRSGLRRSGLPSNAVLSTSDVSSRKAIIELAGDVGTGECPPLPSLANKTLLIFGVSELQGIVGVVRQLRPHHVVGVDTAVQLLEEARNRLVLEEKQSAELALLVDGPSMPFRDASVDYILCTGSLHHSFPLTRVLSEFRRLLAAGGRVRIGVYNNDSVMTHLYYGHLSKQDENAAVDDGDATRDGGGRAGGEESGPGGGAISAGSPSSGFRRDEFHELAASHGFMARELACLVSPLEMNVLSRRSEAIADQSLATEHREFLRSLKVDDHGRPLYQGRLAGYRCVYELTRE